MLLPNLSFFLLAVPLLALGLLPLFGVIDIWTKHRFSGTDARIGWTIALVAGGPPALVVYVIVIMRSRDKVPVPAV